MDITSENQLIHSVQNGSLDDFEPFVKKYQKLIFRAINGYVANPEIAKELTQETFIKAFEKIHQFQFRSKFSTWLYRIAFSLSHNYLKRDGHINTETSLDDQSEKKLSNPSTVSFEMILEQQDSNRLIYQALDTVDLKFRGVLILHAINQISYEEIADITGLTMGTVKSRISRGKQQLKSALVQQMAHT
jgi:RNA polymerase sigma factor (sigma-70 family)